MRVILVDDETELVRCNFPIKEQKVEGVQVEWISKLAAHVVDGVAKPENYEMGSFVPYEDTQGFFVFLADKDDDHASPTTLDDVMSSCNYIGYLRRQ
jgi:hypothetical protein